MPDGWTLDDDGAPVVLLPLELVGQLVQATSMRWLDTELEEWFQSGDEEWAAAEEGGWIDG